MNMNWILKCFPGYEILVEFDNIENNENKQEIHGMETIADRNRKCIFCGKPFQYWKKKDTAHAISECLGNKRLINYCECYECNHLFGEIAENHLGKFIMPYRFINEVYGKKNKNVIKDTFKDSSIPYATYRFEQRKNQPVLPCEICETSNVIIEKAPQKRLELTESGFRLSIPRQKYNPKLVYISLLKIAYTLIPQNEWKYHVKGLLDLYLKMSLKPYYDKDGKEIPIQLTENDKSKYINNLPNIGIEICVSEKSVPNGVNVCLLRRLENIQAEPRLLFAIQMKWYTIVIPVLSDNCTSGKEYKLKCIKNDTTILRNIDFNEMEKEFICEMNAKQIIIPKELYQKLQDDLRNANLLV